MLMNIVNKLTLYTVNTWKERAITGCKDQNFLSFFIHAVALNQNYGNQRVIGVVGLPVGVCLDAKPLFVVLRQDTYPQKGLQHQGPTGFQ